MPQAPVPWDVRAALARGRTPRATYIVLLSFVIAVGVISRLYGIGYESAWHDEALTLAHLDAPTLPAYLDRVWTQDPVTRLSPVYFVVQYLWSRLAGTSLLSVRLLSVLFGVACIPWVCAIGRRLFGATAGLLAGWAFSVSLVHVYFAQEVRFYAMVCFLALASQWVLVVSRERARLADAGGHALLNGLLLWTHCVAPLLFLAQGAYLLLTCRRRPLRFLIAWLAAHAAVVALFAGWVMWLGYNVDTQSAAYNDYPGSWREFANALLVFTGGRFDNRDPASHLPGGVSFDLFICLGVVLVIAGFAYRSLWPDVSEDPKKIAQRRDAVLLSLLWLIVPLVALYAVSHLWKPFFYYRYVLYSAPAICVLAGGALMRVREDRMRIGFAAALCVACAYQNIGMPRPLRPDFRLAAGLIEQYSEPDDLAFPFKPLNEVPFRLCSNLPADRIRGFSGFSELIRESINEVRNGRSVWVVFTLWSKVDEFERQMRDAGLTVMRFVYPGMTDVTICHVQPGEPEALPPAGG